VQGGSKVTWTDEEDDLLKQKVNLFDKPRKKWVEIAKFFPGCTGTHIRYMSLKRVVN
jgi:hypothetical protein